MSDLRSPSRAGALACAAAILAAALLGAPPHAAAQEPPSEPSICTHAAVSAAPAPIVEAQQGGALAPGEVSMTYVGHGTFLFRTPGGLDIVADYTGPLPGGGAPDVATMNGAFEDHFSLDPQPEIAVLLNGWSEGAGAMRHDVVYGDVRVRNVPTDVYRFGHQPEANSIFIFEIGELCIAHLGHLHVVPSEAQYDAIGQIDIVIVQLEGGGQNLSSTQFLEVADRLGARVVIPIHYFSADALARFVDAFGARYAPSAAEGPTVSFAPRTMPERPTLILVPSLAQ